MMQLLEYNDVIIDRIIKDESIEIHFQPIVSVKKKTVVGIEALCRGINPGTDSIIPPNILFGLAKDEELTVDFDRLCRKKALESYQSLQLKSSDLMLFLNIDISVLDKGVVGSGHLLNIVNELNVDPGHVVIEIVESKVDDIVALKRFVNFYRNYGFLIALDDVGSGHSNLDRIPLVKPDILKIDRSLISDIDKKYYKQEVFKSLVNLSKKIGALVVAEGVEREEEAIMVLELGADMLQGFYYSKPKKVAAGLTKHCEEKVNLTAYKFKNYMVNKINQIRSLHQEYNRILNDIVEMISKISVNCFDMYLKRIVKEYPVLECIYILNESGLQVSDTYCNLLAPANQKQLIYRPAKKGTEHSLKEYFYMLVHAGLNKYTTEPYISLASGNLCITISSVFADLNGDKYILCIDINPEVI